MFGRHYYPRSYFPPAFFGEGGSGTAARGGYFKRRHFGAHYFGPRYFGPRNPVIHGGYFGHRYFGIPHFGPHYFSPFGYTVLVPTVPPPVVDVGGGSFHAPVRITVDQGLRQRLRNEDELILFIASAAVACGLLD